MKSPIIKQLMQVLSYDKFKKITTEYSGNHYTKSFNSWSHLCVLLIYQFTGKTSIRDLISYLKTQSMLFYHCGIKSISRNNLSHNNNTRPSEIFEKFYYATLNSFRETGKLRNRKIFKFKKPLKSIDSSTISLCKSIYEWAKFRKTKAGIKMHTVYNNDSMLPEFIHISEAKVNDAKGVWKIPIQKHTIYVLDRAYLCLKWLNEVVLQKSHFVIRLKTNINYKTIKRFKVSECNKKRGVLLDQEICFTGSKKKDYTGRVRRIKYKDSKTNKTFNFITDNFDLSPYTIAEIYKERWQIELFFKKVKQNLKIKKFLGLSENCIKIQIWIAMIALLLYEYALFLSRVEMGLKEFLAKIAGNIFSSERIDTLLNDDFIKKKNRKLELEKKQMTFSF